MQEQVLDAQDRIDKKLLRMFQSAVKAEKVVRALELASQLSAVRSLEGALKLANHHRYTCSACPPEKRHGVSLACQQIWLETAA